MPLGNLAEASLVPGLLARGSDHLAEIIYFLQGETETAAGSGSGKDKRGH